MGTRTFTGDKKRGPFKWKTYKEVNERINLFASGLRHVGVKEVFASVGNQQLSK